MVHVPGGESALLTAFRLVGLSSRDVWLRYLALGGRADEVSVEAQIHGFLDLAPGEYNILEHALNEEWEELAQTYAAAKPLLRQVGAPDALRRRHR